MFLQLVTMERGCKELLLTEPEVCHLKFLVLHVNLLAHHLVSRLYVPPTAVILSQCCITGDVFLQATTGTGPAWSIVSR